MSSPRPPLALFDALKYFAEASHEPSNYQEFHEGDFQQAKSFLEAYSGSQGTFNGYRREVERLLHWTWQIRQTTVAALKREDIENFILFCQDPPETWIATHKYPRFSVKDAERKPNPAWRPFVVTVSKAAHRRGATPEKKDFSLSQGAVRECFAILSSFYNYLLQEEYVSANPVALVRQKSKFIRRQQGLPKIRRLSDLQWQYVIETSRHLADEQPEQRHERTLFIFSALYAMYLRISELAASDRWTPRMNDFYRDNDGHWWFTTVGKGNKERQIAVSDAMLSALKRWRKYLSLSSLPTPADNSVLIPKQRGKGPVTSTTYLREVIQAGFDAAIYRLRQDGHEEEAENLVEATVHWLRHTGISDDVKHRPREHVRDDAGHSSSAITDKYIDIELRERHRSARHKRINEED